MLAVWRLYAVYVELPRKYSQIMREVSHQQFYPLVRAVAPIYRT